MVCFLANLAKKQTDNLNKDKLLPWELRADKNGNAGEDFLREGTDEENGQIQLFLQGFVHSSGISPTLTGIMADKRTHTVASAYAHSNVRYTLVKRSTCESGVIVKT